MIKLLPNLLTPDDAEAVIEEAIKSHPPDIPWKKALSFPPLERIFTALRNELPDAGFTAPGYVRVECRSKGHPPHYDGCQEVDGELADNHMAWCHYGCSVLLSDPESFAGGTFHYPEHDIKLREEHYLSASVHSAGKDNTPELHAIDPHKNGERWVLLIFLARR